MVVKFTSANKRKPTLKRSAVRGAVVFNILASLYWRPPNDREVVCQIKPYAQNVALILFNIGIAVFLISVTSAVRCGDRRAHNVKKVFVLVGI